MESTKKNLWILTEERPKNEVLFNIITKFCTDNHICGFIDSIRIIPILKNGKFAFTYEVSGPRFEKINKIFIKTVSGSSSFVDFLLFFQENEPMEGDIPTHAIEETKTDDAESRNTGIYQRASKFVYINSYFPNAKKIMLYSLQVEQKKKPTATNVFGTRCLITLGVEILGKKQEKIYDPFTSIDELITVKNSIKAHEGNVPILLKKEGDKIYVSGRLWKADSLSYDPNIGALSLISATLRKLGWTGRIIITEHGLSQRHVGSKNKFVQIANKIGIELDGLTVPEAKKINEYRHYEVKGEKLGTIFIDLIVENFTCGKTIYANHAGAERGYFIGSDGKVITIPKYEDNDKSKPIFIPDLVLLDVERLEIINIEGKKYENRFKGIKELNNYDRIENMFMKPSYPNYKIIRTVVLYGSKEERIIEVEVGFLLNEQGKLILGIKAPEIFKQAVKNVLDFWKS